jgi:hypothetical protein
MKTEHSHDIHTGTVDRSNPNAPKRTLAKRIVASGQRLRQRLSVAVGLCMGLAALVVALE